MQNKLIVETKAGKIVAEATGVQGAPGICLYFVPKGYEHCDFDMAMAEVKESAEYRNSGETDMDVSLYLWEDMSNDSYTKKMTFTRREMEETLDKEE